MYPAGWRDAIRRVLEAGSVDLTADDAISRSVRVLRIGCATVPKSSLQNDGDHGFYNLVGLGTFRGEPENESQQDRPTGGQELTNSAWRPPSDIDWIFAVTQCKGSTKYAMSTLFAW